MTKRYNHRGLEHNAPAPGGMGACRPTAFDGGKAEIGGLFGRLIAAPTPAAFGGLPCTRGQRADVGIGPYEKSRSDCSISPALRRVISVISAPPMMRAISLVRPGRSRAVTWV